MDKTLNAMNANAAVKFTPEFLQQHPTLSIVISAFTLLAILFLAGSLASWIYIGLRAKRGKALLSVESWSPRVWGLLDILIVVVLLFSFQTLLASLGMRYLQLDRGSLRGGQPPVLLVTLISFSNLVAMIASVAWIAMRFGVSPAHVGFSLARLPRHLAIGMLASLIVLPLVYLLMIGITILWDAKYQHPLLDEMRRTATLASYFQGVLTAVLFAPFIEEFLFRVILQGWLQSWPFSSPQAILLGASETARTTRLESLACSQTPVNFAQIETVSNTESSDLSSIPPALTESISESTSSLELDDVYVHFTPPIWPAIVTGILFGLAHWGYGLSFIPLIVLGIILGLLYRATHSIWPGLIVHMTLNCVSMLGLGITIMIERAS